MEGPLVASAPLALPPFVGDEIPLFSPNAVPEFEKLSAEVTAQAERAERAAKKLKPAQSKKSPYHEVYEEDVLTENPAEKKAPRQHSAAALTDPENVTDIVPGQEAWSILHMPEILYTFRSPQKRRRKYPPVPMKPNPRAGGPPLKAFEGIPDRISNNVEEFKVEAWMRQDPRIQLSDIINRMPVGAALHNNALQQRGVRFRRAFNIVAWGTCNLKTKAIEARTERRLRARGLDPRTNSTRGLTPGLINPALGEAGGRIPLPHSFAKRYGFIPDDEKTPRKKSSKAKKSKKQVTSDEDEDLNEFNNDEEVDNDDPRDEDYRGEEESQQGEAAGQSDGHGESGADEDEVAIKIEEEEEEEELEHIKQYEDDNSAGYNHHAPVVNDPLQYGCSTNVPGEIRSAGANEFEGMMDQWLIESGMGEVGGRNQNPAFGTTLANASTNTSIYANENATINPNDLFYHGINPNLHANLHANLNTNVNPNFNPNFHAANFDPSLDHSYDPSIDPRFNPNFDANFDPGFFTGFNLNASTNANFNAAVNNAHSNFAIANSNDTGMAGTQVPTHINEESSPGPEARESGHRTPDASVGTPPSDGYTPSPQEEAVNDSYSRGRKRRCDEDEESEYQDEGSDPSSDDSDDNDDDRSSYRSPSRASKRPALMKREASEDLKPVVSASVEDVQSAREDLGYQHPTVEDEDEEDPVFRDLIDMFGGDYVDDNIDSLPQPPLVRDTPPPPTPYVDVKVQQAAAFERIAGTIQMLFGNTMANNWQKWAMEGL